MVDKVKSCAMRTMIGTEALLMLYFEYGFEPFISSTDIVQHVAQRRLLKRINTQTIVLLHLNPSAHILALVVLTFRQPLSRVLVSLLSVAGGTDSKKLRAGQAIWFSICCESRLEQAEYLLVGELFAASVGPGACAGDPGFFLGWV